MSTFDSRRNATIFINLDQIEKVQFILKTLMSDLIPNKHALFSLVEHNFLSAPVAGVSGLNNICLVILLTVLFYTALCSLSNDYVIK